MAGSRRTVGRGPAGVFRRLWTHAHHRMAQSQRQVFLTITAPVVTGRIMSSLVNHGGLASSGGIAGPGGGLAG